MNDFTSVNTGRLHVHVCQADRFKTHHLQLKLAVPLERRTVTATAMLPYLWLEGSRRHPDAQSIMQKADDLYGVALRTNIGKRGDRQVAELFAGIPDEAALEASGVFRQAQALAFEVVAEPLVEDGAFAPAQVARERTLHRRRIESVFDDKIVWAMDRCMKSVYEGERFGLPRLGYVEDLLAIDGRLLWAAHQRLLAEAQVHAYLVGAWKDPQSAAEPVIAALQETFPERGSGAASVTRPLSGRSGEVRYVTDEQAVRQGKLNLGLRTGVGYADPDYPALMVYNGILGGFPHSKLFVNVREKASLAYYASSRVDGLTGVLAIQAGIAVAEYDRALSIILEQVQAMREGRISGDELTYTKTGLRNQYLQTADQPGALVELHFAGLLAGRPRSPSELLSDIAKVQPDDVTRVARRVQLDTVYFLRNGGNGDA